MLRRGCFAWTFDDVVFLRFALEIGAMSVLKKLGLIRAQ